MTAGGGRPAAARCYGPGPRWLCTRVIPELSTIYQRQPAATLPDHGKERTSHVVYTPHAVGPEMGLKAYTRRIGGEREVARIATTPERWRLAAVLAN